MANTHFDPIATLETGRYDYKIKVRIIRKWRASNPKGEEFKEFNVILLDKKSNVIHGFSPWSSVEELESKLMVGKLCSIKNFTVQLYKNTDIYRCLHKDRQLVFTKDTIVQDLEDNGKEIQQEHFDSGTIKVIMEDREVRTMVGIRSRELYDENEGQSNLPNKLLNLANKDYTMLILIQEMNVVDGINVYKATNVCNDFQCPNYKTTRRASNILKQLHRQHHPTGSNSSLHKESSPFQLEKTEQSNYLFCFTFEDDAV